jgi:uncharacterized protein (DUF983 family)
MKEREKPPAHEEPAQESEDSDAITTATCPHCGAVRSFPGFSVIFAFVCSACGEGVNLEPREQ